MATAILAVVLAIPAQALAAADCSAAGSDPTAAQYCPPTPPPPPPAEEKCSEGGSGNGTSNAGGSGSESGSTHECEESVASSTPAPPAESGTLPFTGTDVLALFAAAAALIAVGVAVQRLSRTKPEVR
jgi:hypothetical protein